VHRQSFRRSAAAAVFASLCAAALPCAAQAQAQKIPLTIPAQDLRGALNDFARQGRQQLLFSPALVQGRQARALNGLYAPDQALKALLAGTGLSARTTHGGAFLLVADVQPQAVRSTPPPAAREPAAEANSTLTEVIVTARKRQESILAVPVSETVIGQATLERFATHDLFTLKSQVPGLLMGTSTNSVGTQVSLRGIGTTTINATMDQSISLNIDGLQLSQGVAYQAGMFDVGQVEVLRGPQALFFGKNSPAGVISFRTADPTDEAEVIARAGYEFEAKEKTGEVIVSGPVSPSLKLRLAARYSEMDGFFRNDAVVIPALGAVTPRYRNVSPTKSWIVRGTALFRPTDQYDARLKLNYTKDEIRGIAIPFQLGYCPEGTGAVPPLNLPFITGDDCKLDKHLRLAWMDPAAFAGIPNDGVEYADTRQLFGTLEQNLRFGQGLTLTSVTGVYDNRFAALHEATATGTAIPLAQDVHFRNKQFTQELRLTSDLKGPLNFMAGGFFQDGQMQNVVILRGNTVIGLPAVVQSVKHDVDFRSLSLFGQGIWNITPELEFAAGARWTHERRTHAEYNMNPLNGPLGRVALVDPKIKSSNVSPEVTLTYKPSTDLTLFGSYKQGFKSGSFNSVNFIPGDIRQSFGDERVRGFEVGLKSRLLDRRMLLNLAAYTYRYKGLQVGANEVGEQPGPGGSTNRVFIVRTLNAASAKVDGVDFDVSYDPAEIDGLTLRAALSYNRARYGSFDNAPCAGGQTIAMGCDQLFDAVSGSFQAQDLSGRPLVRAPKWAGTAGFEYQAALGGGLTLDLAGNANYTSRYSTILLDTPGFFQKGYVKFDASLALRGRDDAWELALIGTNLGNKITSGLCLNANVANAVILGGQVSGQATGGPAGQDEAACIAERGRELRVRLTLRPLAFRGR
jgi:iron complex outermembrane receptor protein